MIRKIAFAALAVVFVVPLLWSSGDGEQSALQEVHPDVAAQLYGGKIAEYCGSKIELGDGCGEDEGTVKGCKKTPGETQMDGRGSWTITKRPPCGVKECGVLATNHSCDITPGTGVVGPQ